MSKNPFTPLFGQEPVCIAGRESFFRDMAEAFAGSSNNPNLSSLIVGPRGAGKTVLLTHVGKLAEERGWVVARTSTFTGMLEDIVQRAYESGSQILDQPSKNRLSGFQLAGIMGASWEKTSLQDNWRTQMNRLFSQLSETDTGLLITVDELNISCEDLVILASTFQLFLSEGKKVALVMAGLPGNVAALLNGRLTSFWRRSRQQNIGRISDEDVSRAFRETLSTAGVSIEQDALNLAVEYVSGFAYMFQLLGYWSFENMRKRDSGILEIKDINYGIDIAHNDMRNSVLASTYANLSSGDIRFLEAMLEESGPSSMVDIAKRMGVSQTYASQYRLRLIGQGVIGERGRGRLDFEIPFFREFVQESIGFSQWPDSFDALNLTPERIADSSNFINKERDGLFL